MEIGMGMGRCTSDDAVLCVRVLGGFVQSHIYSTYIFSFCFCSLHNSGIAVIVFLAQHMVQRPSPSPPLIASPLFNDVYVVVYVSSWFFAFLYPAYATHKCIQKSDEASRRQW